MERYYLYTWLTGHLFVVDRSPEDLTKRKITYYSTNINGQVNFKKAEEYLIKPKLGHILKRMRKPGYNSNPRVSDSYVYKYLLTPTEKEGLLFKPSESFTAGYLLASDSLEEVHKRMVLWTWQNKSAYKDEKGENLKYAIGTYIIQEEATKALFDKYGTTFDEVQGDKKVDVAASQADIIAEGEKSAINDSVGQLSFVF